MSDVAAKIRRRQRFKSVAARFKRARCLDCGRLLPSLPVGDGS